jgi:hypothetical protein
MPYLALNSADIYKLIRKVVDKFRLAKNGKAEFIYNFLVSLTYRLKAKQVSD